MKQQPNPDAPKIEFPCENYPVKVLGVCAEDYLDVVHEIISKHAPECSKQAVQMRESSKGSFQSCTLYITATGIEQLQKIHADLMAHQYVRMVI